MKKLTSFIILSLLMLILAGQTIDLTFTAVDDVSYVQLDSIKVMNRTQGGDTVLYWPDTVLSLTYVGLYEKPSNENAFQVFQNYPNPLSDQTRVPLYVPQKDKVSIMVTDILGRVIVKSERVLDKGKHAFRFIPGNSKLYYFTAIWQGSASSIKMVCMPRYSGAGTARLDYSGNESPAAELKSTTETQDFVFNPGNELLFIGYTDSLESGILDAPEESGDYTFQFATNIPCPDAPIVSYGGQDYNTIQVFGQCWLKENINIGFMILGGEEMTENGIIEKYCYDDDPANCDVFGGMYNWDEMMQYSTVSGVQGICPPGWHIPTDDDWKVLCGAVDSFFGIGHTIWDDGGFLGSNTGYVLKSVWGWIESGDGSDAFGFTVLPGGYAGGTSFSYDAMGEWATFWTSTPRLSFNKAWDRFFLYYSEQINRSSNEYDGYYNVRCLRNN